MVANSNSWRRIVAVPMQSVCEPITQNDGHPDLYFRNGGADGPDARLIAAAPDLLEAVIQLLRNFPTDSDLIEAGWSFTDTEAAMKAHDAARAVVARATGEQP